MKTQKSVQEASKWQFLAELNGEVLRNRCRVGGHGELFHSGSMPQVRPCKWQFWLWIHLYVSQGLSPDFSPLGALTNISVQSIFLSKRIQWLAIDYEYAKYSPTSGLWRLAWSSLTWSFHSPTWPYQLSCDSYSLGVCVKPSLLRVCIGQLI